MTYRTLAACSILALSLGASPVSAQKEKRPNTAGIGFVVGPKGERPHLAGLNAVLMLTDDQKQKLALAREDTLGSEGLRTASRKVKEDPNATEAERQAARRASEAAQGEFDRRVAGILTPAQKELVQRFESLYLQAKEAVAAEYEQKLVGSKGNRDETARLREEARTALAADFARRVRETLTPEQRAAFELAAAEEKQAAAKQKPEN
jgi:hypothetical protein